MKKIAFVLMVMVSFCLFSSVSVFAVEKWAMGCSGAGSGPYSSGAAASNYLNKKMTNVRFSAQATAGYNENVALVTSGEIEIGMQQTAGLLDAYQGKNAFKGHPHKRLRLLFPYTIVVYHVVTRKASDIKTVNDLKGAKFNISLPSQTTRTMTSTFLKCANIDMEEIKIFQMATGQTFQALQDGVIDGTGNGYTAPHGRLLEAAIKTPLRLLNIPDDVIDCYENLRGLAPKYTIAAGTYNGQDEPVKTFAYFDAFFARDDLSEELVYEMTKAFWSNLDELKKIQGFNNLKPEYAYSGKAGVPYHPGALKYYKEIGLLK